MSDRLVLFGERDPGSVRQDSNPMVRLFGLGPDGQTCRSCRHLIRYSQAATWSKCALRCNSGGRATDHRSGYRACAKYEGPA